MAVKKKAVEKSFAVPLKFKPMEGFGGGFRTDWVSAEHKGLKFGLDSGADMGNPSLTFCIEKKGKTRYYTADIGDVLRAAIVQVEEF